MGNASTGSPFFPMPKPKKIIPLDDQFIGDLPDPTKSEGNCHRQEGVPQFYCEDYYVHEQEACEEQCTACKFENRVRTRE